jgi:hypothetical protein
VADWVATECRLGLTLDRPAGTPLDPDVLDVLGLTADDVAAAAAELPSAVGEMESTLPIPDSAPPASSSSMHR